MGSSASSERRRHPPQQQVQQGPRTVQQQQRQYPGQMQQQQQQQRALAPRSVQPQQPAPAPMMMQQPAGVSEAQSVKNEATVMVESVKYDKAASLLRFRTNTTVPSEMEVHVAVRVDLMQGQVMITPNKPKAPPPKITVEIGEHDHEVPIDLSNVTEQEQRYLVEYPRQLPIVIALYYMPTAEADPQATKDGMNRCEYTMAQMLPEGKFVKQLLRTRQGIFKIENLFGGEHADVGTIVDPAKDREQSPQPEADGGPTAGVAADDDEDGLCVICLTNEKNTAVIPCRHMCLCNECAEELRQRGPKCPVCRGPLHQLIKLK